MLGKHGLWERAAKSVRRAFGAFLAVPIAVVVAFVLLAVGIYFLDAAFWSPPATPPGQLRWLGDVFGDKSALGNLLSTIATSLITATSITFSLLLIAVQQGASAFTNQVFDQFLRRRGNQLYFGYFVGLSVFALIELVVVGKSHRPVFGALVAVVLTGVALCLIVVLIYTTINQTRPNTIIETIRGHVLKARERQLRLLAATRRCTASQTLRVAKRVSAECQGYVTKIDVARIARAIADTEPPVGRDGPAAPDPRIEVGLLVVVGSHVAYGDLLAELRCNGPLAEREMDTLAKAIVAGVKLEDERDLEHDPAFGLSQLAIIGWTSVSTAKSNPNPGLLVCHALRDILSRWLEQGTPAEDCSSAIVFEDRVPDTVFSTLESLAVVASESMQHQTLAEILLTLASLLPALPTERVDQVADLVLRSLSALGEHVLTVELERALEVLSLALAQAGRDDAAKAVTRAKDTLGRSIGVLNSRSTRAHADR